MPLLAWWFTSGTAAIVSSLALALLAAVAVGAVIARFTDRPRWRSIVRQVLMTAVPAALTYAVGSLVGVSLA